MEPYHKKDLTEIYGRYGLTEVLRVLGDVIENSGKTLFLNDQDFQDLTRLAAKNLHYFADNWRLNFDITHTLLKEDK